MTKYRSSSSPKTLKFLFKSWSHEPAVVGLAVVGIVAATSADLLMPVYSGRIIDALAASNVVKRDALHSALTSFAVMAALSVVLVGGRWLSMVGYTRLTLRLMIRFAEGTFDRIQHLSTEWHVNNFSGATLRGVTRGMWATQAVNRSLILSLLPALIVLVGSTILLGYRWPLLGSCIAVSAVLYTWLSVTLTLRYVEPSYRLANLHDSHVGAIMAEALTCNSVVKAFGAEVQEEVRLRKSMRKWGHRAGRAWSRSNQSGNIQLGVLFVFRFAVLACTIFLWFHDRATPGDIAFVLTSYFLVHGYLREVGQNVANLQAGLADMESLVVYGALPLGVSDASDAIAGHIDCGDIRFEGVDFRYPVQSSLLFQNLHLHIPASQKIGLVGCSGSGKTTLIKLIHRLYDVDEGRILIDGLDIRMMRQSTLRSQIAIVPQDPILFHRSLAENIAYGRPGATRQEIEAAARAANAEQFILRQEHAYQTRVGERGVKLSGGERQRIALARAFLADAPIVILDEATSSLDSESEMLIQEAVSRLMVGRTCIVIAHRLSTIRHLDRILVLVDGRIVEDGRHEELLQRRSGAYRNLFEIQALGIRMDIPTAV